MNRNLALALAFGLVAGAAQTARADDFMEPPPFVGTLTRAEVRAELDQARQSGTNPWADDHNPLAQFQGSRTREEVTSEYLAGRATVAAMGGEDGGSMHLARQPAAPQDAQHAIAQE